jgi:hypothetical protein
MRKKSRIKAAAAIIASIKIEMQKPRLSESVREGLAAEATLALKQAAARPVQA